MQEEGKKEVGGWNKTVFPPKKKKNWKKISYMYIYLYVYVELYF